jgi:ketosteroid isomerase-like protein
MPEPRAGLVSLSTESINSFAREFEALYYQGDFSKMASYYSEEGRILGDGTPLLLGRTAIASFWRTVCAHSAIAKRTIRVENVIASSDLGYVTGTVVIEISAEPTPADSVIFNYVTVWKREDDGLWRIVVDSSSRDTPSSSR